MNISHDIKYSPISFSWFYNIPFNKHTIIYLTDFITRHVDYFLNFDVITNAVINNFIYKALPITVINLGEISRSRITRPIIIQMFKALDIY